MRRQPEVRSYDYVNHAYEAVRDALRDRSAEIFQEATNAATSRAKDVASALRVNLGSIEIATRIRIKAAELEELPGSITAPATSKLDIEWESAKAPHLFPFMRATLAVYPLSATETQLELYGTYDPPMGALGDVMNAVVGRRVAEASVHRFVLEVADYLRRTLSG